MQKLHVAIDIYLTICVLEAWKELPLKGKSKNAGICSVVGEAVLYNATVQLGPRNRGGGGGGGGGVGRWWFSCQA